MKYAALLVLAAGCLLADDPAPSGGPQTHMIVGPTQVEVIVSAPGHDLTDPPATPAGITITYQPSGTVVPAGSIAAGDIRLLPGTLRRFQIIIASGSKPGPDDRTYNLKIVNLLYAGGTPPGVIAATGSIYDKSNIKTLVDATSKALSTAKTTDEKDLFAGFNIAVPSSGASATQGDFTFNKSVKSLPKQLQGGVADSGSLGLNLKKGSDDGKDPRHFNLGFNLRKTFLFANSVDLDALRTAILSAAPSDTQAAAALSAMNNIKSHFWRAFLFDYGLQMEGDVSAKGIGNVSNTIGDFKGQIATAAKPLLGDQGFLSLRFMPAGFELGRNITNTDNKTTKEVGNLARYKTALELRAYYQSKAQGQFIDRVELTGSSIYRRLFNTETAYNTTTKTNVNTTKGDKLWTQVDFKIFSGLLGKAVRPGLKVSYQRGYLPPVYTLTKVFTYGLVFESSDGGN